MKPDIIKKEKIMIEFIILSLGYFVLFCFALAVLLMVEVTE